MFQVKIGNRARKNLKKISQQYLPRVIPIIDELSDDSFMGEKMAGRFADCRRVKLPPIRIIYSVDKKAKIVWVQAIGHRGDIYK